ncbi:MAG: DUF4186 family protein [Caldilineaceae bacterium SB0665_bin_25]|nr:DUF4186 family protein [Caldilineaceae bacterium SB0665_bin_25]
MDKDIVNGDKEKPLAKITCSSYDCEQDLHCFRRKRPKKQSYRSEECVACGAQLVEWQRLDKNDLNDVENTFKSLERELIRHHFWHKAFDDEALKHAEGQGLVGLRQGVQNRLRSCLRKPSSENSWDGRQTPLKGRVIYYAQHATATCCRKCAEIWHGFDREKQLTDDEFEYMSELVMKYIDKRLPDLPSAGPKARPQKTKKRILE